MKKIIILLVLIVSSCGIEYDGETKIVIKGKVVDSDNNPIINKEVNLFVIRESSGFPFIFYSPSEENNIGKATTNSNGEYIMVIPQPKNNFTEIIVETNSSNNTHNPKQYRNIKLKDFLNYELNLPISKLYHKSDLSQLSITPNNINLNNELKNIELLGLVANELEFINLPENYYPYYQINTSVKKNQTIIARYTVLNHSTNITSIVDENIVIDNSNQTNYTLNY